MKVTLQNGAVRGLTRRDVEAIIPLFPPSWSTSVSQIVLYQGQGPSVSAAFYAKSHTLGLFWPRGSATVSKVDGLEELLVALSVASERGELPATLSKSIRKRHSASVADMLVQCMEAIERNAT